MYVVLDRQGFELFGAREWSNPAEAAEHARAHFSADQVTEDFRICRFDVDEEGSGYATTVAEVVEALPVSA